MRPEGSSSGEPLIFKEAESEAGASYALGIVLTAAGVPEGLAEGEELRSPRALERDVWTHLAFTYDGARMRLYLDGERVAERLAGPEAFEGGGPLRIGCDGAGGHHFDGRIDEVRIYERALNTGEIATDMTTPLQTPLLGPVAGYSFDEGEGTSALDDTGEGNDGTIEGASWVNGKYRDALGFDGQSSCVTVPNSASLQLAEEFTLQIWVRPEGALSDAPLIFKETEGGSGHSYAMGIGFSTSGRPQGFTEEQSVVAPGEVERNVWTNIAYTYDGGRMRLFVNGQQVANEFVGSETMASTGPLHIGCDGSLGDHFDGRIDEARIYDRALSPAEVVSGLGPLPYVQTEEAHGVNEAEAVFYGQVDPQGEETSFRFEYGLTTAYGHSAPEVPGFSEEVMAGDEPRRVEESVNTLEPETTYHFRVLATSDRGTAVGRDQTLTTGPVVVEPAAARTNWHGFFNLMWSGNGTKTAEASTMAKVQESGATTFRVQIGDSTCAESDQLFEQAALKGIRILPYMVGIPAIGGTKIPSRANERSSYVKGLGKLVACFGHGGSFWTAYKARNPESTVLPVEWWEIWNEENYGPNGGMNGKPAPALYGDLLSESHGKITGIDPQAKVLVGALLSVSEEKKGKERKAGEKPHLMVSEFLEKMKHTNAYEGLSLHPYAFRGLIPKDAKRGERNPTPTNAADVAYVADRVEANIRQARAALDLKSVAGSGKPILVTEIGWPVQQKNAQGNPIVENDGFHLPVGQEIQRDLLNKTFSMIEARSGTGKAKGHFNIEKTFFYNIEDVIGPSHSRVREAHCGLLESDESPEHGQPRKAWSAFENFAE